MAHVDRFDYAADGSEDDRKEAASTKVNESSKVRQLISILTKLLTAGMCFFFKPSVRIDFRSSRKPAVTGKTRTSFSNSDLPAGTLKNWQLIYLPAWYQYLGTVKDPWSLNELLPEAQRIWDKVFPQNIQTLSGTGEPIFYLVSFYLVLYYMTNTFSISKTKQRSYEWRGNFAAAAITAVQEFWNSDPQYATAEDRANFVEWAIPEEDEEPSPFTWASVDESDSDNVVSISLVFTNIFLQIPGI